MKYKVRVLAVFGVVVLAMTACRPVPIETAPSPTVGADCLDSDLAGGVRLFLGKIHTGQHFELNWELENTGSCSWKPGTRLVRIQGGSFGDPGPMPIEPAGPGEIVSARLQLIAPDSAGEFASYWRLQGPDGVEFGRVISLRVSVSDLPPTSTPRVTLAVATQTAQPPTSTPTLDPASIVASLGDEGPYVTAIQYLLRAEGYALDTSGIFDPATEALVIQFQARQGLRADGIIEHETLTALVREHELEMGDQGDDVRALQYVLVQRCRAGIPIDGVFGESTRRAVIRFQTFNVGSFFDGIVGQTTWRSLISDRYCD